MRCALFSMIVLLSACSDSDICGEAENNDGGYSNISVDDAGVVAAATFAVEELADDPAADFEVVCAQTQVVDGTNYRLGLDFEESVWRVVVYDDDEGTLELTSSTQQ